MRFIFGELGNQPLWDRLNLFHGAFHRANPDHSPANDNRDCEQPVRPKPFDFGDGELDATRDSHCDTISFNLNRRPDAAVQSYRGQQQ
jgi:hypothetical protein